MADILCPTCSKPNPEELEICQYCGALLKNPGTEPLAPIHPGEMPTPKKTAELERTLPAWLRDIRKDKSGESAEAGEAADTENSLPSLSHPEPAKPQPRETKAESPLDLLAGLSQSDEEEEEVPDWLANLKTNIPAGSVPSPEPQTAETDPQPADWLAGLQTDSQSGQSAPDQPDTSSGFDSEPVSFKDEEEPAPQISGETPDWLTSLQPAEENTQFPAQPVPAETSFVDDASSTEQLPDWINSLGSESAAQAPELVPSSQDVSPTGESTEMSEWLSGLENNPPATETPSTPATFAPSETASAPEPASADVPDWLADMANESAPPIQTDSSIESGMGDFTAPAIETPGSAGMPSTEEPPASGDLPDWLATAMGETASEKPPADSSSSKAFSTGSLEEVGPLGGTDSLPDWMSGLDAGSASSAGVVSAEPEQPSALPTEPALQAAPPQEQPAGFASETPPDQPEAAPLAFDMPASEAEAPSLTPASENEQNLDSILSMDMPDWLSGFTPTESDAAKTGNEQALTGAPGGDISPANLPSWVQAMRPMESVISGTEGSDEDQSVEKEGPLAGLRSVLPPQTGPLGTHKPRAYSIKLQVDATQQTQAALLENLIASEAESQPIITPKRVLTIRPLRWIIAVALLLAVFIPAVLGTDILGPAIFPLPFQEEEVQKFREVINTLPDSARALVVFDYQPAYVGEMEQIARPVVEHLMSRNASMAFISTSPMGVLMNERMMAQYPGYPINEKYVDLGYLPGGEAGIQVFASDPTKFGNKSQADPWTMPALAGVETFSGFGVVIVLTDNPDTGRMWIEQTSQALQGKPMLMVISAQAEPMIRPYYPGQIKGLVSGLAGGAAYQQSGSYLYWDSYAVGMIAAELLIVIGGIWALVEHLRARRTELGLDEDEA